MCRFMYKIIHVYVECLESTDEHELGNSMQIMPCENIWTRVSLCHSFSYDTHVGAPSLLSMRNHWWPRSLLIIYNMIYYDTCINRVFHTYTCKFTCT